MSIVLYMRPKDPPMSWRKFCRTTEPFSIALDGYVAEAPRFQPDGPRANFNHHEEVDRLSTRATCAQILIAIRQGLFTCFRDEMGNPKANIFVNDCDEDVCTSLFLLKYGWMAEHVSNPVINRLVYMEDLLDATAGAYPVPTDSPILQELAWIFEPYRRFRINGGLDIRDTNAFTNVVTDVEHRIMQYIVGRGEKIPLDLSYEKIGGGSNWIMVREIGAQARNGMFADGIRAFVSVRERPNGRWSYIIGRMSAFIPGFDIPLFKKELNKVEGVKKDKWGGADNIIGSSRINGSRLSPDEVANIINQVNEKLDTKQ